jgi:anti-anti-sigma factor
MDIIETSVGGVPLLTIVGEADHAVGPQLEQAAHRAISSHGTNILLDLELCPYLDSGALNVIIGLVQRVRPQGWVGVVHCSQMVLRLLHLVGLVPGDSFRVFQTLAAAKADMIGGPQNARVMVSGPPTPLAPSD